MRLTPTDEIVAQPAESPADSQVRDLVARCCGQAVDVIGQLLRVGPDGIVCPACAVMQARMTFCRQGRLYRRCVGCQHQRSVTSGTVLDSTKLTLTRWFLAMQLLTQFKNIVSALELKRQCNESLLLPSFRVHDLLGIDA